MVERFCEVESFCAVESFYKDSCSHSYPGGLYACATSCVVSNNAVEPLASCTSCAAPWAVIFVDAALSYLFVCAYFHSMSQQYKLEKDCCCCCCCAAAAIY